MFEGINPIKITIDLRQSITYINESTDYKEPGCIRRVVSWQRP